jgi:predicted transcriptional regulator
MPSPQDVMMQMWMGLCSAHAVAAAARLGIVAVLAASAPRESAAWVRAVGADVTALTRLLRTLVSLGILTQPDPHARLLGRA